MTAPETLGKLSYFFSAEIPGVSQISRFGGQADLSVPDQYRDVMVSEIERCRGRIVDAASDSLLVEFHSLVDAVNCGSEIRLQLARFDLEPPRIGVALDAAAQARIAIAGQGMVAAERLRMEAQPGELRIQPTLSGASTIRIEAQGLQPGIQRKYILAFGAFQLSLLLVYFLFWYGLITVKAINIALYGSFCWPKFMCDDKTPHPYIHAGEPLRPVPRSIEK